MNTKNKQNQKNQGRKPRQEYGPKKRGQDPGMHEHERPETRLTR